MLHDSTGQGGYTLLGCVDQLTGYEKLRTEGVMIGLQLPWSLTDVLFPSFYPSLLNHSQTHARLALQFSLCPCHFIWRPSVLAFISPYIPSLDVPFCHHSHPTPCQCSFLLPQPLFLSLSPRRRCQSSVIGIQALSESMQSPVSRIREETSLSGFPQ